MTVIAWGGTGASAAKSNVDFSSGAALSKGSPGGTTGPCALDERLRAPGEAAVMSRRRWRKRREATRMSLVAETS